MLENIEIIKEDQNGEKEEVKEVIILREEDRIQLEADVVNDDGNSQ